MATVTNSVGGAAPQTKLPDHVQVNYLLKLLEQKGKGAARELGVRIKSGEGITVKQYHFRTAILEQALQRWAASEGAQAPIKEPIKEPIKASAVTASRPPATPQKLKESSPRGAKRPLDGSVGPEAKNRRHSDPGPRPRDISGKPSLVDRMACKGLGRIEASPSQSVSSLPQTSSLSSLWGAGGKPNAPSPKPATGLRFEPSKLPKPAGGEPGPTPPRLLSAESPASEEKIGAPATGRSRRCSAPPSFCPGKPPASPSSFTSRSLPSVDSMPGSGASSMSVSELKSTLSKYSVDFSSCVEKAELQALWNKFEELRSRPLMELRTWCMQKGGGAEFLQATSDPCARFLLKPAGLAEEAPPAEEPPRRKLRPVAAPQVERPAAPAPKPRPVAAPQLERPAPAPAPAVQRKSEDSDRRGDALQEARRILAVRRSSLWGFHVLDVALQSRRDVAAVQRCYRLLMKKLHPDKVGDLTEVANAIELIREAKDACERSLSRTEVPAPPRALRYEALNVIPGSREFKLHWHAPAARDDAPVQRYIVAALDPAYGKPLTVTVIEPDYNQQEQRYVTIDELTSYVLSEKDLTKMPSLWTKDTALLHVASANDAGQSQWTKVTIRLSLTASTRADHVFNSFTSAKDLLHGEEDDDAFEAQLRNKGEQQRRAWLEQQKKASISSWLRFVGWPPAGNKDELIKRVLMIMSNEG